MKISLIKEISVKVGHPTWVATSWSRKQSTNSEVSFGMQWVWVLQCSRMQMKCWDIIISVHSLRSKVITVPKLLHADDLYWVFGCNNWNQLLLGIFSGFLEWQAISQTLSNYLNTSFFKLLPRYADPSSPTTLPGCQGWFWNEMKSHISLRIGLDSNVPVWVNGDIWRHANDSVWW